MFRRKLSALEYHNPTGFDCKGRNLPEINDVLPPHAPKTDNVHSGLYQQSICRAQLGLIYLLNYIINIVCALFFTQMKRNSEIS